MNRGKKSWKLIQKGGPHGNFGWFSPSWAAGLLQIVCCGLCDSSDLMAIHCCFMLCCLVFASCCLLLLGSGRKGKLEKDLANSISLIITFFNNKQAWSLVVRGRKFCKTLKSLRRYQSYYCNDKSEGQLFPYQLFSYLFISIFKICIIFWCAVLIYNYIDYQILLPGLVSIIIPNLCFCTSSNYTYEVYCALIKIGLRLLVKLLVKRYFLLTTTKTEKEVMWSATTLYNQDYPLTLWIYPWIHQTIEYLSYSILTI